MSLVEYEQDAGTATITFNRPEKRNALTYAMLGAFQEAVSRAGEDPEVRAVIVTGAGGAFSAGTDLSELASTDTEARGGGNGQRGGRGSWWLSACPKPVVAAVDGPAVGLGAELTSQADVRVATTRARFGWNFVLRGLIPDTGAGTWLLPRLVGVPTAVRWLYSGELIDADEALRAGYVSRVVAPEELVDAARAEAERFSKASPFAVRRVKELVYEGLERGIDEHLRHHGEALQACFRSEDHREGVTAFLERREPRFTGA